MEKFLNLRPERVLNPYYNEWYKWKGDILAEHKGWESSTKVLADTEEDNKEIPNIFYIFVQDNIINIDVQCLGNIGICINLSKRIQDFKYDEETRTIYTEDLEMTLIDCERPCEHIRSIQQAVKGVKRICRYVTYEEKYKEYKQNEKYKSKKTKFAIEFSKSELEKIGL